MDCWRRCGVNGCKKLFRAFTAGAVLLCLVIIVFEVKFISRSVLTILESDPIDDIDTVADPCKNFYQFACGNFLAKYPPRSLLLDLKRLSRLEVAMNFEEEEINRLVLHDPDKSDDIKPIKEMKRFVKTCLDEENIKKEEIASLKRLVNEVGGWQLIHPQVLNAKDFDWVKVAAETRRSTGNSAIISLDVGLESENYEAVVQLKKPSFGLSIEMLTNSSFNSKAIDAYKNFIYSVASELGSRHEDKLHQAVQDILSFEIRLADLAKKTNTSPIRLQFLSFPDKTDDLLKKFVELVVGKSDNILVEGTGYWFELLDVLRMETNETIRNYVVWRLITGMISEATPTLYKMKIKFEADLGGSMQVYKSRTNICLDTAKNVFGRALRSKYVEEKVDPDAKQELKNMTSMMFEAAKATLKEAECMGSEEKEILLAKIDKVRVLAVEDRGEVEKYYDKLKLGGSYLENQMKINSFEFGKHVLKFIKGEPHGIYWYKPGIRYQEYTSVISISPAFLRSPLFAGSRPKYQSYAMLGFYIAHEIGHAVQYTSPITLESSNKKMDCLSDESEEFLENLKNLKLNWPFTFKEDFADMFGLRVSWRAYQDYLSQYGLEKEVEQFTIAQLFFLAYAQGHCESVTPEALANQIKTDTHSPAEFRVNEPLKYFSEFAKAFNCPVDVNGMNPH